jgi:hypothetical protein
MAPRRWPRLPLLAVAFSLAPLAATAQLPSYARPFPAPTIAGTIADFDGKYRLTLSDDRGYLDDVTLHKGTVIVPSGKRLTIGMRVRIHGRAAGKTFDADEADVSAEESSAYATELPSTTYSPPQTYDSSPSYGSWPPYGWYGPYSPYYYPAYPYYPYYQSAPAPVIVVPAPAPIPQPSPPGHHMRRPLVAQPHPYVVAPAIVPRPHLGPVAPRGGATLRSGGARR